MIKRIFLFLITCFILQSCGTVGKTAQATGEVESQKLSEFRVNYQKRLPNFQHLQIKSKIDADLKGKSNSATLRLYIDKGSVVWANLSLLGITGARAKITPSKVQAYEIVEKTYVDDTFDYINQKLKVDFIDYTKLEQLLLGQLFLIKPWNDYDLNTTTDNQYELSYKYNAALKENPKSREYIHTFYLDSDYKLKKVEVVDSKSKTEVTVNYNNWRVMNGKNLPGSVKILVKGEDTDQINLDYNNFEFSEMNPPFKIPKNYTDRKLNKK